jgi:protein-disulfide isomerase
MLWIGVALMLGVLLVGLPGAPLNAAATDQSQTSPAPVVAVVNGKEITAQELLDRVRGEMSKLEAQMYEVRRNGAEELISDYLLEQTAQARGLTKDQLLQQEVDSKVSEVTDKEVENFYAANQARIRKPLDEVRPQILNYLQQNKLTEARRTYLKSLRDKAQVKVYLTPPIVDVSAEDAPIKGPANAPITIVEFSDFQCSYCKRVVNVLDQVVERYPDKVKLAFRDFPIVNIHPQADKAAEAAHCAGEQGKFWEFHDLLFEKQDTIPTTNFTEHAKTLGLEVSTFQTCLDGRKYQEKVERNYAAGVKAGVSGTPAFFINGRLLSGAQPLEAFKAVIDEEIERLGLQAQR